MFSESTIETKVRIALAALLIFSLSTLALAHPGGGMVALDANTVVFADPLNNIVWRIEKGTQPFPIASGIHAHWVTRGLDGRLYAESLQEMDGALFRIDSDSKDKVLVAKGTEINAHVFAVGKDGEIIFQKEGLLVERKPDGLIKPYRGSGSSARGERSLTSILAYTWGSDGSLWLSDGNRLGRAVRSGEIGFAPAIEGTLIEPQVWNSTGKPRIWSIARDSKKRIYLALPDLGQVIRIDEYGKQSVIDRSVGGWRVTAVATFDDSIFMLENSDRTNDGPRVRVIRPSGKVEILGEVMATK